MTVVTCYYTVYSEQSLIYVEKVFQESGLKTRFLLTMGQYLPAGLGMTGVPGGPPPAGPCKHTAVSQTAWKNMHRD